MQVRILLADDHKILRQGLRALLEREVGLEVVAEADTSEETVRLAGEFRPHVIVLDVPLSGDGGTDLVQRLRREAPDTKIIGLSTSLDGHVAASLLRSGVAGYLAKTGGCEELCQAIRDVMAGHTYLEPEAAALVARASLQDGGGDPGDILTTRQLEVLRLYTSGLSTKEIAIRIGRSVKTVEMHRQNVMERLRLRSVADLTKYAIRKGLASLDS